MNPSPEAFYRAPADAARRVFDPRTPQARRYYGRYVDFVAGATQWIGDEILDGEDGGLRVLDVGCGSGASSWLLAEVPFDVVGADVSPGAFAVPHHGRLRLVASSVLALPFADGSFEVVASYQMLEHVRDPAAALREMTRVLVPGGVLVVAGPNLMSPLNALRSVAAHALRFRAAATDARLPMGNTLPTALGALVSTSGGTLGRLASRAPSLAFREPDLRPPARGDSDACFLLNPMDIAAWMRANGYAVVRRAPLDRPWWTYALAGGTWVIGRKI